MARATILTHREFTPIPCLIRKCIDAVDTGANEVVCWGDVPIDVGSGQEISIRSLSKKIADLTGSGFRDRTSFDDGL
jgi:hypothetical protein